MVLILWILRFQFLNNIYVNNRFIYFRVCENDIKNRTFKRCTFFSTSTSAPLLHRRFGPWSWARPCSIIHAVHIFASLGAVITPVRTSLALILVLLSVTDTVRCRNEILHAVHFSRLVGHVECNVQFSPEVAKWCISSV